MIAVSTQVPHERRILNDAIAWKVVRDLAKEAGRAHTLMSLPTFSKRFAIWQERVRSALNVPETSFSPRMERVLYGLAHAFEPKTTVFLGSYRGYGAAFAGAHALECSGGPESRARLWCCDVSAEDSAFCRNGFGLIAHSDTYVVETLDAFDFIERLERIDCLVLDVDCPMRGKAIYAPLLEAALRKMNSHGIVLAHDVLVPRFSEDLMPYLKSVADPARFLWTRRVSLDDAGLEVSCVY
ncbi:MAG: hypothetical protein IOD12_08020 [Silvanigrellales bacterium]|jgi:predicted O-methyltransferase YrrM|nr:hypothetical protein [Silvanigrellales bacterium]